MKKNLLSYVTLLAICIAFPTAQVAAQTPNTLPALTALISSLCSGSPSCYDTIVTIVSSLVALLVNALNLRDLAPGTNCLQIILNIILRLVNAILALINCLAQVLLTTLQTAQTNCCQVLTALVNTIVTLLINVVDNLVDLLSAVLSALGGGDIDVVLAIQSALEALLNNTSSALTSIQSILNASLSTNPNNTCIRTLLTNLVNTSCITTFTTATQSLISQTQIATNICVVNPGPPGSADLLTNLGNLLTNLLNTIQILLVGLNALTPLVGGLISSVVSSIGLVLG